jgi:hypothetical protein
LTTRQRASNAKAELCQRGEDEHDKRDDRPVERSTGQTKPPDN